MPNTPNYNLYYPSSTDRPAAFPAAQKTSQETLDTLLKQISDAANANPTSLPASVLTSGTISRARLPIASTSAGAGAISGGDLADLYRLVQHENDPIENLDAQVITSGTFNRARIPLASTSDGAGAITGGDLGRLHRLIDKMPGIPISAPGRPDLTNTTDGAIDGNEPVGSTFTSTTGPQGAWQWIKKGTSSSSWEVTHADTGWRDVTESVYTDNWNVGSVQMRRDGSRIRVRMNGVSPKAGISSSSFLDISVGWRRDQLSTLVPIATNLQSSDVGVAMIFASRIDLPTETATRPSYFAEFGYTTADPWPSTLPGTAA